MVITSDVSESPAQPVDPLVPAAQYIRMSTEHQQYSTENQADMVADYAAKRGYQVIATYADEGKSGLRVQGRDALKRLIADVQAGQVGFQVILVYDVSRWGRFQDCDESAYYEYICRSAGIHVEYCAEQFENDGTPTSNIIKTVKRAMAGEYSRELSAKVFKGQCRLIELGYRQGGAPGYGLRRMLIDQAGQPKGLLARGEHKSLQTDRVILVPGPEEEINVVRHIYQRFTKEGWSERQIATWLNDQGIAGEDGRAWSRGMVHQVLSNEKYIGHNVYNRVSFKLKKLRVQNPLVVGQRILRVLIAGGLPADKVSLTSGVGSFNPASLKRWDQVVEQAEPGAIFIAGGVGSAIGVKLRHGGRGWFGKGARVFERLPINRIVDAQCGNKQRPHLLDGLLGLTHSLRSFFLLEGARVWRSTRQHAAAPCAVLRAKPTRPGRLDCPGSSGSTAVPPRREGGANPWRIGRTIRQCVALPDKHCGIRRSCSMVRGHSALPRRLASGRDARVYRIHACAVPPEHVHLVVGRDERDIEQIVGRCKSAASQRLRERDLHPLRCCAKPGAAPPTLWAARAWHVYLNRIEDVHRAIRYVCNNPLKEGKPPQRWSFITPFTV